MERLTKRENGHAHYPRCFEEPCGGMGCRTEDCEFKVEICERLAAYEDTGLTPGEVKSMQEEHFSGLEMAKLHSALMELKKHQEADKDGRLVVLPCKVGDTVWANLDGMRHPRKCVVEFANIGSHVTTIVFSTVDGLREQYGVNPSSFGKTVFLTREEAEKALKTKEGQYAAW